MINSNMKFQEIVEAKKKFADIPCPGCGDPKCDHKQEHMTEGQTTTDYVDIKEFGDYIKQYGGTDVDVVANKVLAALQVHKTKSEEIFYKVEAEAGYNVNGKPVDKSLIRKIVPKRIPDDVVGTFIAKHLSLKKGSKLKPNWTWREDPKAFTQHPDMIALRNFVQDKMQQALDSGNVPITIQHFDQDVEMRPQFRLNIQTNEGTRCWKGYKKKGMKTMFGKRVPNCVKEVNTGNPHKGKYVIKTDEPGRKDSAIVVMPDEKTAKDMASSLSKKKPEVNYWVELVEDLNYKTKAAMEKFVNSGGKIGEVNNWDNPTNDELEKERQGAEQFVQDRKENEMAKELQLYMQSQKRYNYETTKRNFYAKYGPEKAERMLAAMKDKNLFI